MAMEPTPHAETQMEPCILPSLGDISNGEPKHETYAQQLALPDVALPHDIDLDSLYQLAFALLLRAYVRTNNVAFALLSAEGTETAIQAHLDEAATLLENVERLKANEDGPFDAASADTKPFNTALCLTPHALPTPPIPTSSHVVLALQIAKNETTKTNSSSTPEAIVYFRSDHCDQWGAQNIVATFESILATVKLGLQSPLSKVDLLSSRDREQITAWNAAIPPLAHRTLNECFEKVFRENADKEAVYTSEGSFTYAQLDDLSSTLALHLVESGVMPNMVVPICMDKSRWVTCAMTAVWKAGGALTAMEPENPDERLLSIVAELKAKIVICDAAYASRFQGLGMQVISNIEALVSALGRSGMTVSPSNAWSLSSVASTDLAFVVFTSGSTGKPKGILNTHSRLTTEHQWYREDLGYHKDARCLQFASYAYVPGTADNYRTLLHGATLCVPSKYERISDLVGFINRSRASRATLTPSLLQTINPAEITGVRDLVASGEPVSRDLEAPWSKGRRFVQIYGSTEGGSWLKETIDSVSPTIGSRPVCGDQWLIDPHNVDRLVPIGATGEIVLETHETTIGYLNDPVATARAFLKTPAWADERNLAAGCKYLRLGDLGRYESDGSITVYGRADTQVKINGQRVDLQDIESNLRALMPAGSEVIADVVKPIDAPDRPLLVAFYRIPHVDKDYSQTVLQVLPSKLSKAVPQHMIPKVFILTEELPRNFSQKIDRRKLRTSAEVMGYKALLQHTPKAAVQEDENFKDEKELVLAQLWAKVLGLELEAIKRRDNFLELGGDSLSAIRLVPMVRSKGLKLSALDILINPVLKDMAQLSSSFDKGAKTSDFRSNTSGSGSATVSLQATDFQEWAAIVGAENGGWIDHFIYDFSGSLDVDRLRDSCKGLVAEHSILRTTFVLCEHRVFLQIPAQVDIPFDVHRAIADDIEGSTRDICAKDRICPLGAPIVRFDLVTVCALRHRLIMRLSHAHYDGFGALNVGQHLRSLYLSQALPPALPFHEYVGKLQDPSLVQRADKFWRTFLQGSQMPQIVKRTRHGPPFQNSLDGQIHRPIEIPSLRHCGINPSALVKTAWALTLSSLSQCTDIVFGDFVAGRQAPIAGIETVFGPCVNFTPVRVQLKSDLTNLQLLKRVQENLFQTIPHESLGFRHIIDRCTDWGHHARFSSIVNFINFETSSGSVRWDSGDSEEKLEVTHIHEEQQHDKTDLFLMCLRTSQEGTSASTKSPFDLFFRYSKAVYEASAIEEIAEMYCESLLTLATALDAKVLTPWIPDEQRIHLVPSITS